MTLEAQHISVSINRPFDEVNDFLAAPQNFELWAAGLGHGFKQVGDEWVFGANGEVKIRFTEKNPFGIADHTVLPPDGSEVYVPLRVVANGDGSEVTLTLFRQSGMTDAEFVRDQGLVRKDLEALKAVLEK